MPGSGLVHDVVIVGYGAAGANAAIAAHDAGARVVVVEKCASGGGNSALCAGAMVLPGDLDTARAYYHALAAGTADAAMVHAFADAMMGMPALLARLGVQPRDEPTIRPTYPALMTGRLRQLHVQPTGAQGFALLDRAVRDRNIAILAGAPVTGLVQHAPTGAVRGVLARVRGEPVELLARQAVVLTCGGYASNPVLLARYNLPGAAPFIFPWGAPGNTGDGLRLAVDAGAALWHMDAVEWGKLCARVPSTQFGTAIGYGLGRTQRAGSYLLVNRAGQRFMAEDTPLSHNKAPLALLEHDGAAYRHMPAFLMCDQAFCNKGPLAPTAQMYRTKRGGVVGRALVHQVYDWSADNQAEMAAGWVIQAASIAALAGHIGVDPMMLARTVRQYNHAAADHLDTQFGRNGRTLVPLGSGPYYAVEVGLAVVNTQGGPKRNVHCQVLDRQDRAIPRLYAAGELGSFFGALYQVGSNYPEAWAFGQVAGRMAAAEPPWTGAEG